MTKITKSEKLLREATSKWNTFLKEGAFKKTLKEFDEDDAYHFDQDKSDNEYTAAGNFKMGDVVKVMNRGSEKDEPEELRCRVGTVVGMDGLDLTLKFENGEVANVKYYNAATNKDYYWSVKGLYKCPEQVSEGGTMGEYGKMDAEQGLPPTKIGRGNEEYMAAYNAVLQARGEKPLDIQQPDQKYLDALRSGQLEEQEKEADPRVVAMQRAMDLLDDLQFDSLESALDNMNTEVVRKLGIMLKQLDYNRNQVGNIKENEKKKFKVGEFVRIIGGSLKGATGKVIELVTTSKGEQGYVIELYSDAKMKVFGQRGDEVIATAEDMESGGTTDGMELYDIDEKLSAADKEFHKSVMDKGKVPNLKGDMGPIPGLEGPFQYRSGAVLYYDPKAGKYYDRGKDMYLDNDEAARLIMEKDEKEFAKIFARAKDMLVLSARSRVPVSLKSVQSSLDVIRIPSEMEKGKLIVKNEYIIADKNELPESAKQISFTKYAMDYLSNLPGEQLDLPME